MTNPRKIAIICYSQAGKGKSLRIGRQLQEQLQSRQINHTLFSDQWPADFNSFTDVFIAGGDGTLNYFINRYPNISIPLSIFKGGSGNDFAWKLYGNKSFDEQLETALNAVAKPVDAGLCNGYYFLNGLGIGFDGEVVQAMGKKRFISAGHLAYLWTVVKKIAFYRENELRLVYNGEEKKDRFFLLSIANGSRYGGGFMVAPQAVINDGLLDLVEIRCIHRLRRLFYLPKVEKGKHLQLPFVSSATMKKIIVHAPRKVAAHLDGEFILSDYFDIGILPGKFKFRH
jgi:YegS/Rv2252/BmrU family lipid kinase